MILKIFFNMVVLCFLLTTVLLGQSSQHYFELKKVDSQYELSCCIDHNLFDPNLFIPTKGSKRMDIKDKYLVYNGRWENDCLILFGDNPDVEKFKSALLQITTIPVEKLQVTISQ